MEKKLDNNEFKTILIKEARELEEYIIKQRREFHKVPETLYEEIITSGLIKKELEKIGYITESTAKTGIIAVLKGTADGPVIALRADIDGLNVAEETDVPFKSEHKGKMHACGHDAHIAMLLGAAKLIYKHKDQMKGTVKLIFQPAEEGGGGAKLIVEEGHFNNVDKVFGIHVWSDLEAGKIVAKKGALLASADNFSITIKGKGGHAAIPHQAIDPVSVFPDIYNALQKIITREVNALDSAVLSIPMVKGSDAMNIIPSEVIIKGTLRTYKKEIRKYLLKRIDEVVAGYCTAWRCEGNIKLEDISYPPVINDQNLVNDVIKIIDGIGEVEIDMVPSMGSEDFSFYLEKTPGVFILLGIGNDKNNCNYPHHHPMFKVDESALWKGAAVYASLGFYPLFKNVRND